MGVSPAGRLIWRGAAALLCLAVARPACCGAETVTVVYQAESPTCGIQEAVDRLKGRGGAVSIPAGLYVLRAPIQLGAAHGSVWLHGEGDATVLRTDGREYRLKLSADARAGAAEISVADTARVRPGDAFYIYAGSDDNNAVRTAAAAVEGAVVRLSAPLRFSVRRSAAVVWHTGNAIYGEGVSGVTVSDMKVVGGARAGFIASHWLANTSILLLGENLTVRNVTVTDSTADAISLQSRGGFSVSGCRIDNTVLTGVHVGGTNTRDISIAGNRIRRSGHYGIYLCNECRQVFITNNAISETGFYEGADKRIVTQDRPPAYLEVGRERTGPTANPSTMAVAGIGGIGAGRDEYVTVTGNIVSRSRGNGISFQRFGGEKVPGRHILLSSNTVFDVDFVGIYLFAANTVLAEGNMVAGCMTGVSVRRSGFCVVQSNLLERCATGIEIYSGDPDTISNQNTVVGNTFVGCVEGVKRGPNTAGNVIRDNTVFAEDGR